VEGDDEELFPPCAVLGIGRQEDLVLDGDRVEVARAGGEQGERGGVDGFRMDLEAVFRAIGRPESDSGLEQVLLPGVGADGVAEEGLVVAPLEAVLAPVLFVGPSFGEFGDGFDFVVDDGAVADGGSDDLVAARRERVEEAREVLPLESPGFRGASLLALAVN
jgi:hypothetical protein